MADNNTNITQNATNNINNNNSAFTQTREKPKDVPTYQLANPQEDHHQILTLANTDPSDHQLPQQLPQFSHDRPLPIPAQWPMLMLNIAIPGVTQLPDNLKRPTTSADPVPKLITPIVDQEWLHLLFKHPQNQDYNQWRAQYMEAPTILETNIHIALRKLQLGYLQLVKMQRRSRDPVVNQIKEIRNEFAKLDLYTQNWVLQLLAGHPQAPKHSKMNCDEYVPGKDHVLPKTWKRSTVDIENYVNRVTRFWDSKLNDDHYKNIPIYPHQKYNLHPMFVNWSIDYPYYKIDGIPKAPTGYRGQPKYPLNVPQLQNDPMNENVFDEVLSEVDKKMQEGDSSDDDTSQSPVTQNKNDQQKQTQDPQNANNAMGTETQQQKQQKQTHQWYIPENAIPQPATNLQGPITYYYEKVKERKRYLQAVLERAIKELKQEGKYNQFAYPDVYKRVHDFKDKKLKYLDAIKRALRIGAPRTSAYGPVHAINAPPRTQATTQPYNTQGIPNPTAQTQQHQAPSQQQAQHHHLPNQQQAQHQAQQHPQPNQQQAQQQAQQNPFQAQPQQHQAVPNQPQAQQQQQQQPQFQPNSQSNEQYYQQLGGAQRPGANQFQNPQSMDDLEQMIYQAFSQQQLPQRDHYNNFPAQTTGQVHVPAPPHAPVQTRYPNINQQGTPAVHNFTQPQMDQINQFLAKAGYQLSPTTQQAHVQAPAANTS